jgi:hypothetical protein
MANINVERKVKEIIPSSETAETRRLKNQACIELLNEWLADESGYDEKNWPKVKEMLEANRLSDRELFNE